MVIMKDHNGDLTVMIPRAQVGAAPQPDGSILIKVVDHDSDMPIYLPFDPDPFGQVVEKFQAAYGSRIVAVSDEEVKQFGQGTPHGDEPISG